MSGDAVVKVSDVGLLVTHELLGDVAVDILAELRDQLTTTPDERQLRAISAGSAAWRELRSAGGYWRLNPAQLAERRDGDWPDEDDEHQWDAIAWRFLSERWLA